MKWLLILCAICFVAATAAPDDMVKLMESNTISETVASPTPTEQSTQSTTAKPMSSGTAADRTRLVETIFKGYNKKVIPDNAKASVGFNLIDFSVCEKRNILGSYGWMRYDWEDDRLKWDPTEYGGTTVIRHDSDDVWKPDITLYNSADPVNMINCWQSNVLIYSTGKVLWVPPCKMTTQCHFDLNVHPYGEQTCTFKFGSWTYDGLILDIKMYNETAEIDLSDLQNTSGFEVLSTTAKKNVKYYSCCPEPYADITFNMTIKRIPGEELFNKI